MPPFGHSARPGVRAALADEGSIVRGGRGAQDPDDDGGAGRRRRAGNLVAAFVETGDVGATTAAPLVRAFLTAAA